MNFPSHFLSDVVVVLVFGLAAIGLLALAFKVWDWMTPKLDEQHALNNGNVAVAVVLSAYLLAVSWIIVTVVKHVLGS